MPTPMESPRPDDDAIRVERRADGAVVVRVRSAGGDDRLPDAVFSFRCGDPQYAYWLARLGPADSQVRMGPADAAGH